MLAPAVRGFEEGLPRVQDIVLFFLCNWGDELRVIRDENQSLVCRKQEQDMRDGERGCRGRD